jgi:hypothetical protein
VSWELAIPDTAALVGTRIFQQALLVSPQLPILRVSNAGDATIGVR